MANPTQRHVVTELLELRERVLMLDPAVARGQSAPMPPSQAAAEEPAGKGKGKSKAKSAKKEAPSKAPALPPLDVWDKPSFEGELHLVILCPRQAVVVELEFAERCEA